MRFHGFHLQDLHASRRFRRHVGDDRRLYDLLVLSDLGFGIAFGTSWGVAFSLGILSVKPPTSLIAMITLSLIKDSSSQA